MYEWAVPTGFLTSTWQVVQKFINRYTEEWVHIHCGQCHNGLVEQPSSSLIQMCMVQLLRFLQFDKITQVSFAGYHSKHNFVEWVHAEGPFQSKSVHPQAAVGWNEHHENMEEWQKWKGASVRQHLEGNDCCATKESNQSVINDENGLQNILTLVKNKGWSQSVCAEWVWIPLPTICTWHGI